MATPRAWKLNHSNMLIAVSASDSQTSEIPKGDPELPASTMVLPRRPQSFHLQVIQITLP